MRQWHSLMQWSRAPSAGFTSGEPWIFPGTRYAEINASRALPIRARCFTSTSD
ncbi:MAG: alpha-amylase family glycosyl hydrolase [Candidatus Malihini olakiniferum]